MTTLRFTSRALIIALATLCAVARAEPAYGPDVYVDEPDYDREFLLGIGYSRVSFSGAENPLDDYDAVHFDPVLSFAPLPALSPLRLGASVGLTFSLEDVGGSVSSGGGGAVVVADGDTSLILFQPEVAVSWRQPLGDEDVGFFVEPGVCGGGTFAFFDVDDEAFEEAGGTGDPDEWDAAFHARAFLRAGLRVTGGLAGLEASYLRGGNIDLGDDTGGDIEQWYVGIFGALKF
jgi:hypothetical protein